MTHERIGVAISDKLCSLNGVLDVLIQHVSQLCQDDKPRAARRSELISEIQRTELVCQRLMDAIEQGKGSSPLLVDRLQERQECLVRSRANLEQLDAIRKNLRLPTKEQILDRVHYLSEKLLALDREGCSFVESLVGPIKAVPFQQFGSNKVVLRARFTLRLAALLPNDLLAALQDNVTPVGQELQEFEMLVDLFEASSGPKHFRKAIELSRQKKSLEAIGDTLGITKRQAHIAVQYAKQLEAAGLSDPFIELIEPPQNASRWRAHRTGSTCG